MEQSWVNIVDTAIKVGLGSFIAAVSGYLVLRRTQTHEEDKEHREIFYKNQEDKKKIYVEFLSQSQSLVQSRLVTSCDTDEYKNYLHSYNEVQIISPDEVRLPAYNLLLATNELVGINKNDLEIELGKTLRSNFDEKLDHFQKVAQIEVTKPYKKV